MPVELSLLVGLGNPGDRYEGTRHNVGFECLDRVRAQLTDVRPIPLEGGELVEAEVSGSTVSGGAVSGGAESRVLLLRPLLYMNRSGGPTIAVARRFQLCPSRILVVYDDLDLPLGRLRVRRKGSSGGHNGVSDLIDRFADGSEASAEAQEAAAHDDESVLGPEPFPRIRMGIGKPTDGGSIESHVLGRFTDAERPTVDAMVERAAEAAIHWFRHGIARTMNEFNRDASAPPTAESGE